jgi:septal ring factor EnvC (AmiA/AmiB activator)
MLSLLDPSSIGAIFNIIFTAGGYAYAWFASRTRATAAEIEAIRSDIQTRAKLNDFADLEAKVSEQEKRIAKLENEMIHLPSKDMVTEIKLAISELKGSVGQLGEKVSGMSRIVNVIDETLREKGHQ